MINRELIKRNAPNVIGQQVHINHEGCSSGDDRKKRLYIKRIVGGILAYCHHCSEHGFVREKGEEGTRLASWLKGKPVDIHDVSTCVAREQPVNYPMQLIGQVWLRKHYCEPECLDFMGTIDAYNVGLVLRNPDNTIIGWQVRNLHDKAIPKYTTRYTNDSKRGDASWFHKGSKTLVILEDYLSAWRVAKDTTCSSVALLKTSLSDKTLQQIAELNFEEIYIWLDPDAAGIKGAKEAYKKLTHFLPSGVVIAILGYDKEPKEYTPEDLKAVLT